MPKDRIQAWPRLISSHLDLYAYGGDEYTGRYAFVSPTGTAAGYGSPLVDYSSCRSEVALNACNGANRNIYEGTAGYWYRLYRGEYGRIEYGEPGCLHASQSMEWYRQNAPRWRYRVFSTTASICPSLTGSQGGARWSGNSDSHGSREAPRAWERSCWKSPPGVPPIPTPVPTIVSTGLERTIAEPPPDGVPVVYRRTLPTFDLGFKTWVRAYLVGREPVMRTR